jgi:hypothetical protein
MENINPTGGSRFMNPGTCVHIDRKGSVEIIE